MQPNVLQVLPALEVGGVERGTLEIGRALVDRQYRSHVVSRGGKLVSQLEQEGSRHLQIDIGRKSPLTFRHIPTIKKYILENAINIVHVRSRMPAWVVYLAWRSLPEDRRPVLVSTVHGPYSVNFYSKVMVRAERVIAISDYIRDYILSSYPDTDANRITLIHRGVDNRVFNPDYRPPDDWTPPWEKTGEKIITLPGRITRWKGQMDFIHIIKALREQGKAVHGVIAGGAEKRRQNFLDELEQALSRLNMQDHISLIGQRDDMRQIMKSSDIVMSLARTPEAFGRTALEALCLGTPVVAYDHGGAHEVLKAMYPHGLTEPLNIEAAASRVSDLLEQSWPIAENRLFTLDNMVNKTLQLYGEAIEKRG